jgi:hypothetical protein
VTMLVPPFCLFVNILYSVNSLFSPDTLVQKVPEESFFCGISYEDASDKCSLPCPSRASADCPGIDQCFAYTPCSRPESFFCGENIVDANESCAIPCPSGSSNTCPMGQSCYAYTECESPTDLISFSQSLNPSNTPSSRPTQKPSQQPTRVPTQQPTTNVSI